MVAELDRTDVIALALPGFGCAVPEGFGASKEHYVDWLTDRVAAAGRDGPVDLVGHDWGGGFVNRLVSRRPELVRSWVTDTAGMTHERYEWHDFAKMWQTPEVGEAYWEDQLPVPPAERSAVFEAFGVPPHRTGPLVSLDRTMVGCILAMYRSSIDIGREWGPDFRDIRPPGMAVIAADDGLVDQDLARDAARRAGAGIAEVEGAGHWWMLEDPARGAKLLEQFWASL